MLLDIATSIQRGYGLMLKREGVEKHTEIFLKLFIQEYAPPFFDFRKCARSWSTQILYMENDPDYHFCASQVSSVESLVFSVI